ncbi:Tetratricopeptide TPR_2 [unidentified eubacterium SCB49]|nr:Tetratricopeptide TPR_2 [unidentified eubacterium SCB49]
MENTKTSFLSFFLRASFVVLFFFPFQHISAQKPSKNKINYNKIISPKNAEDLTEGYAYFKKQKEEKRSKLDTTKTIFILRMLAIAEFEMGQIYASENTIVEAIKLLDASATKKNKHTDDYLGTYNHLGMVYREIDQPKRAIATYNKALAHSIKLKDSIILLNNIANCHKELEQYDKSISIFELTYNKVLGLKDKIETARALDNLGHTQFKAGYTEGLPNMLQALEIRKEVNHNSQLYTSYKHLSEYYNSTNNKKEALTYATLGKETAAKVNTMYYKDALSNYLKLNENSDISEYIHLNDSIRKATLQQDNKFASIEYNINKEKERTLKAKLDIEKERRLKTIFQLVGIFIILIAIALYVVLKYRHKKEKIEQVYHTETKISKKIHDEVANDIYKIMAKIQTTPNQELSTLDDLEIIYNKTRDISKEHATIDLKVAFGSLLIDLLQNYQSDTVNVITKNITNIDWSIVDDLKKKVIYRVIQELMTNMHKHSGATLVVITASQSGKKLKLKYADNGVVNSLKKGSGLLNTETRIQSVNGSVIFETNKNQGLTATISL